MLSQLCYCFFAFVCFRFPSSHLFVSVTQSNVPNLPVHTSPEKFGGVPPLAVPDSFLSSRNPAHGMIVTPSSAPTRRQLPSFLPSSLRWWLCSWPWQSWHWANKSCWTCPTVQSHSGAVLAPVPSPGNVTWSTVGWPCILHYLSAHVLTACPFLFN